MKAKLILILAFLFLLSNSDYSISQFEQQDIVEEADLLLDMMEYEAAIVNYLKGLSQDPQQRDVRKKIGYAYYQLEKVDDALNYIREELNLFPDNGNAYDLLVYILYKLDKIHEANNFLDDSDFPARLTEENPHIGGLGCFIMGMHFKEIKIFEVAKAYFRKAIEKGHDPVKCYIQLIDTDLIQGREIRRPPGITRTPRILEEAIQSCGNNPEFIFMDGLQCVEKSKTRASLIRNAIEYFENVLELNPFFKDALFNLAVISYNYKDYKRATEYFREILEIEPENNKIKFYLDCCLKELDKSVNREPAFGCPKTMMLSKEFIDNPDREYKYKEEIDIHSVLVNLNYLALEFIKREKYVEAIKRLQNGLKIYHESPEINFNLATIYSWQNNLDKAEKHSLIALRKRGFFGKLPSFRIQEIYKEKGDSLYRTHHIPLSEWTFEVALKEGNYFLDAYNQLGTLYFKRSEFDKAILAFKKVIEIYQGDAMGHYNLGCAYWAIDDKKNAEKEWKDAIKYEEEMKRMEKRGEVSKDQLDVSLIVLYRPVAYRAHKSLGWLYLERNLKDKALKEFERALKLEPEDPEPYYEIGKIYEEKSEHDEKYVRKAISYYERYLYLGGEKEKEVRALLKSLK